MSKEDNGDSDRYTHTTIEVKREVWRQVRSDAVADGVNVSEKLEEVLQEYYDAE